MITWFEAPKEGLSPGGKIEFQTLTATENKTYSEDGVAYTSVTVNVEGGGGSSDFSTATVTTIDAPSNLHLPFLFIVDEYNIEGSSATSNYTTGSPFTIILYKGKAYAPLEQVGSISGNIEYVEELSCYVITGDCTITFSVI